MSLKLIDLLNEFDQVLDQAGIEAPRLNVERMLEKVIDLSRIDLYLNPQREITLSEKSELDKLLKRRLALEPLQYILGETEFYGLKFISDKRALIPRPETEFVVSEGIHILQDKEHATVLDLATGSGNIIISLAVNLPTNKYYASDISERALALARENAQLNQVSDKIDFRVGSLYKPFENTNLKFDLILANPPYIKTDEYDQLHEQVRKYEPNQALFSGLDGLDFIRIMLDEAPLYLHDNGYLVFEIALGQLAAIKELVANSQTIEFIKAIRDYSEIDRVVVLKIKS